MKQHITYRDIENIINANNNVELINVDRSLTYHVKCSASGSYFTLRLDSVTPVVNNKIESSKSFDRINIHSNEIAEMKGQRFYVESLENLDKAMNIIASY